MKGYKVFNSDWTCRGFQYKVGETFEEDVKPSCCSIGFHFCTDLIDCFNYYDFNPENKIAEIEALGDIDINNRDSKCCTNKIKIVHEISWEEALKMLNAGKNNTGLGNSGNYNIGDHNSGSYNNGDCNSGHYNNGDCNSGNHNNGDRNSGYCNDGYYNNGDFNIGDYNSGDFNIGDYNSGSCNNGDCNVGNWNKTSFSTGCFNTKESTILMFNKPSNWTQKDWRCSDARKILQDLVLNMFLWINSCGGMTKEEKELHPESEITGGYLSIKKDKSQSWWNELPDEQKNIIKNIPNFDAKIFEEITGIKVD